MAEKKRTLGRVDTLRAPSPNAKPTEIRTTIGRVEALLNPATHKALHQSVIDARLKAEYSYVVHTSKIRVDKLEPLTATEQRILEQLNNDIASSVARPIRFEVNGTVNHQDLEEFAHALDGQDQPKGRQADEAAHGEAPEAMSHKPQWPKPPSLDGLIWLNDLVPSPKVRKTLNKMIADQLAHVSQLHADGKYTRSKLAAIATWGWWACYFLKQLPWAVVIEQVIKRITG